MQSKNQGSALITALFIMTIITIIVTSMSNRLRMDIHSTQLSIDSDRLLLASQAVTYWAIDILKNQKEPKHALDKQGKLLDFPSQYKNIYPNVILSGAIYDLQAKFNLNNLTDPNSQAIFFAIISQILPDLKQNEKKFIVDTTSNWIKGAALSNTDNDSWLDLYLKQKPILLPGYQLMKSVSEFRSVLGVNKVIYQNLSNYITTLPETTANNINTTPKTLLLALSNNNHKAIQSICDLRANKEIKDLQEISALLKIAGISSKYITTTSNYFLITAKAKINDLVLINYLTIKTTKNFDNSLRVDILNQSFNTKNS